MFNKISTSTHMNDMNFQTKDMGNFFLDPLNIS